MEYRKLGSTNIDVSVICLGTMTYGEQNSIDQAHQQLDYAIDHGVNFIDTAEMYPVPPISQTYAKTEEFIGKWEKLTTQRDKIILATKVVGKSESFTYIRNGHACLDKKNILAAIDSSLQRLNVDYIDLYQLHWPDRLTNCFGQRDYIPNDTDFTSFHQLLEILELVKKSGKVRNFGVSNETPWGLMSYINSAVINNLPRMESIQNPYSLLNRTFEIGLSEISYKENCGLLAYSPLAFGVLTGKYLNQEKPLNARLTLYDRFDRYNNENATRATQQYVDLANKYELSPAQMALAFVNTRKFVTSTIIGATTMQQLKTNIASIDLILSDELLEEIEMIHSDIPNPAP
jgi:aryl-alcohol dehydrogenase-like predicted oxidoreductase